MIVVDSSVLAGFVIPPDAYHSLAMAARDRDPLWHGPHLIRSEVRNIGRGYLRKGENPEAVAKAMSLAAAAVETHVMGDVEVLAIVRDGHLTAYDSEFVALARRLGCRLVTTDAEIVAHYPEVAVRLADFSGFGVTQ